MLLFTYPRDFRLRFGSEMVATFSDLVGGEWEHKGLAGVVRVWRSALAEVFLLRCHFSCKVQLWLRCHCLCFRRSPCLWRYSMQCRMCATANS
jgi:hypothetical protein